LYGKVMDASHFFSLFGYSADTWCKKILYQPHLSGLAGKLSGGMF
jgi:hypothetical protein